MDLELLKQVRLLYVEDDESIRKVLSRGLKRRVKELEVAVDGKDGLEKFRTFKPDVIVSDIKMPNMTGLEMTKLIREEDPDVPVIITSAHGETDILLEAIEYGVSGYILKPIDKDKLIKTIVTHAKVKLLEAEVESKNRQLMIQSKNAAIGELIENLAHQWRQPLSVISMTSGSIQLKNELDSLDKEFVEESTEKIISITKKLSSTIDYFRNTYITNNSKKESFFVQSTIDNILCTMEEKLNTYNIKVIENLDNSISIESYQNMFIQSIIHLINNAVDALKEVDWDDKYIFIDAHKQDDELIITVKDNGGGVAEKDLEHVFEPYYTTHHKCEGKGLGLHMVLQMLENGMKGTIDLVNEDFTYNDTSYKGAKFTIRLK